MFESYQRGMYRSRMVGDRRRALRPWLIGLGVWLMICPLPAGLESGVAQAATITTTSRFAGRPTVLDQNGQAMRFALRGDSGEAAVPSYLAYRLRQGDTLSPDFPRVSTPNGETSGVIGATRFDSLVKSQLDANLTRYGIAAIGGNGQTEIIKPAPTALVRTGDARRSLAELSSRVAVSRGVPLSAHKAAAVQPSGSTTPTIQGISVDKIADSKFLKDVGKFFTDSSNKVSNWGKQAFDSIKSGLNLDSPKNVAPPLAARRQANAARNGSVLAQELNPPSEADPLPSPVPEPATFLIFGVAAGIVVAKGRRIRIVR